MARQGQDQAAALQDRLRILQKRRGGAGVSTGGMKERTERLKLVDHDIKAVQDQLKKLTSLQGRVRERRAAEQAAGVERGKP